jgi:hypothetical protein
MDPGGLYIRKPRVATSKGKLRVAYPLFALIIALNGLSIGIFFTLMIVGVASMLPATSSGLEAHGVSAAVANHVAALPPVSILFAAFLGYNPIQSLVGAHTLSSLSPSDHAALVGHQFFPRLIAGPFESGLHAAFTFAFLACLVAAGASLLRGGRYQHGEVRLPALPRPEEQHAR